MKKRFLIIATLFALAVGVFGQIYTHEFVSYDDNKYITNNETVKKGLTGEGIRWALTTIHASNWHPLTWISHMTDVSIFGLDPRGHHLMNLFFHLLNAALLFLLLESMTGAAWRSAIVAALFLVHPLHVESVAWAAERKDLLSALFGMLAIGAYVRYTRKPGIRRYILVPPLFVLSLMSKPMLVTLPFLLLLLDFWPIGRLRPLMQAGNQEFDAQSSTYSRYLPLWDKMPLAVLSLSSSLVTLHAQVHGDSILSLTRHPLSLRAANATVSYATYLIKTVWPISLAVFYPLESGPVAVWKVAGSVLLLILLSAIAIVMVRRTPSLIVGWLWYLGMLVPVIGLVQVGMQAMADRYTYVPLIGLFIMAVFGLPDLISNLNNGNRFWGVLSGAAILLMSSISWFQVHHWADSEKLFSHAIQVTEGNWIAHYNLAVGLSRQGRDREAIPHFQEALRIRPYYSEAHKGIATAFAGLNLHEQAAHHFRLALMSYPNDIELHNSLGTALGRMGRLDEAVVHFKEILRLNPNHPDAINNIGAILELQGRNEDALLQFQKALSLHPDNPAVHRNMAVVLEKSGKRKEAITHYKEAIRLRPGDPELKHLLHDAEK